MVVNSCREIDRERERDAVVMMSMCLVGAISAALETNGGRALVNLDVN